MAYNNYYPQYNSYPYTQQVPTVVPQAQPTMQIQNGGFISVRSEIEARNYPVALGNSITFKDENAPYVYTKTMGFSQLESPKFEKYRLIKEEDAPVDAPEVPTEQIVEVDETSPIDEIKGEIGRIKGDIKDIRKQVEKVSKKS